jgi:spoIIIJ-associated protein
MEWVETTAKTIEAAREAALDQLGVGPDEAEFDVIEEPRPGLFGRMRGEARLRARVRPAQVRPKQERRRRGRSDKSDTATPSAKDTSDTTATAEQSELTTDTADESASAGTRPAGRTSSGSRRSSGSKQQQNEENTTMSNDDREPPTVTPEEVGAAAVAFVDGLTDAFGVDGTAELRIDGLELDVAVSGTELGLLVGPGGRTLNAIQDLARVSAQRRLGDHETRLRIDVAGYRERREAALAAFARDVAEQVRNSGTARSLEPMTSADRKVVHDVLNDETGVTSRSVGVDPDRRIIVEPA